MFNKKLIINSLKNLSKPTKMTNKNTFDLKESGSKREGFVSAQEGVDTPIYKAVKTGASPIEGKGLFAEQSIRKGDVIGVSHIRKKFMKNGEEYKAPFPSTVLGYYNHSEEPNVYEVDKGDYILMVAGRDIQRGHEITSDYTKHNIGDLEVPDDFKKGGSIKRPSLPNRKSPRSYSRSFEATNKLFAKNPLFAKAKSRKNKIFDPRAQYYRKGGVTTPEEWGQQIKDIEGQIGNPSGWTLSDYNTLQNKLNEYKSWRENTPEGQAVIDTHNEEREYDIPLPEHLQDYTNAMMKARLAYANEFGNPATKRMINIPDNPYQFDNGDTGTHYMASYDNYAVPQIQDENGVLQLGDYGPESNEAIRFDSDEDANYFAEHYKDVSPGFLNQKQYGGLHKFLEGGGNPTCPKDYKWNPETNRCEKKSGCPENFHFDPKSGRCISNYQKESIRVVSAPYRYDKDGEKLQFPNDYDDSEFSTVPDDELVYNKLGQNSSWPKDFSVKEIVNPIYFQNSRTSTISMPDYIPEYEGDSQGYFNRYPDLNYKVVVDSKKPEGYNKDESIYYVKSENTHQFKKYKEWEKLKQIEKENLANAEKLGFVIKDEEPSTQQKYPEEHYKVLKDKYDEEGNNISSYYDSETYDFKPGINEDVYRNDRKKVEEFYNDPEYLGNEVYNKSFDETFKDRGTKNIEKWKGICPDCTYYHGQRMTVDPDYVYSTFNPYQNPVDEGRMTKSYKDLEYEYADPTIESMYPKLEFEEGVDRPDYYPSDYDMKIPTIGIGPGEQKSRKRTKRLMNGKGQKYTWTDYRQTKDLDFGTREATRPIPRMVQKATGYDRKFMEGYEDEEGNYIPGEIEKAEQEGRQINFKGASSLRDRKQQKIYNEKWKNSEEENKLIRQQNEDLLKEYGLNREEYVKLYGEFKNGGLIKAADGYTTGVGDEPSITATPFDFRSSYGQIGNYHKNPNYSLTYTNPKLLKKLDMSSNALSFTLGRPYNTDAASLTNPTLDFSDNTNWNYIAPEWEGDQAYQNFWQNATASGNNESNFNSYQAAQNLASLKPKYKKGLPLIADVGYDLVGNAFGNSSNGPFTGAAGWHVGYAPESGLYGNMDASIMGVFGRRKNRAKIKPNRYYSEGLTRQGDYAFIPKLNILNFQVKQRPDYNKVQEDEVLRLMEQDRINGTQTARAYQYKMDTGDPFDLSLMSPEVTFQAKPFKNIPGILSATAGARLNFEGGKQREGIPITPNLYGNVRYTIPLGEAKRQISARMPDRRNYQNDEEREETETETENETNGKPTFNEDIQLNFDGQGVGKANCRDGYERPCEKCKCQKIKLPTPYTDKRGKKIFGNEPITFKQGGISLQLTKDEIQKYVDGGYVVEDSSSDPITFKQDNETEYELGGIIEDEETKKYLESIGYTFETI